MGRQRTCTTSHALAGICLACLAALLLALPCLAAPAASGASVADAPGKALTLRPSQGASGVDGADPADPVEVQPIFVKAADGATAQDVAAAVEDAGADVRAIEEFENGGVFAITLDVPADEAQSLSAVGADAVASDDVLQAIADSPAVSSATHTKRYHVYTTDKKHGLQWEFAGRWSSKGAGVGAEKLRSLAASTKNTATIAVVDSGFRAGHQELKGVLLRDLAFNALTGTVGDIGADPVDHGTGVASVLVAKKGNGLGGYGICANTKVLPITAGDANGDFDDADILEALEYVEKLVKKGKVRDLHVVNLSFGAWYTDAEKKKLGLGKVATDPVYAQIKRLYDKYGILCVCAGGNDGHGQEGSKTGWNYPADYPCCVSVTASDSFGYNCPWSDVSPQKDITAPGDSLIIASARSDKAIDVAGSGTSLSAPIISGCISSLIQVNPKLSAKQAYQLLVATATPVAKSKNANWVSPKVNGSAGIPNAEKAAWRAICKKKGKKVAYWDGMTDFDAGTSHKNGYTVTSAKNKTVSLTLSDPWDGKVSKFTIPATVKLGDGKTYRVTAIGHDWAEAFYGKVGTLVIGCNVAKIGRDALVTCDEVAPDNILVKTRKLKAITIKNCLSAADVAKKVSVRVSSSKKTNARYVKEYGKIFTKKVCGCVVRKVVAG